MGRYQAFHLDVLQADRSRSYAEFLRSARVALFRELGERATRALKCAV